MEVKTVEPESLNDEFEIDEEILLSKDVVSARQI